MKKYSLFRGLITLFVVIIGIGAIGWFVWNTGQIFVALVTDQSALTEKSNTPDQTDGTEEILSLPPLKFWTCQAGVFNNKENASQLKKELRSKGWKVELVNDSPTIVAWGYFLSKSDAKACSLQLEEQGLKNFVKEMKFPSLKFKVRGKCTSQTTEILRLSNRLLREEYPVHAQEMDEAIKAVFSSESPLGFEELNDCLHEVIQKKAAQDQQKNDAAYNQELLRLFVQYSENTVKYLNNSKSQ